MKIDPNRLPWAIRSLLDLTEGKGNLLRHSEKAWGSVTFSGVRHRVVIAFAGDLAVPIGEAWLAVVPGAEFSRPGELVADIAVQWAERTSWSTPRLTVELEVLTLFQAKEAA